MLATLTKISHGETSSIYQDEGGNVYNFIQADRDYKIKKPPIFYCNVREKEATKPHYLSGFFTTRQKQCYQFDIIKAGKKRYHLAFVTEGGKTIKIRPRKRGDMSRGSITF